MKARRELAVRTEGCSAATATVDAAHPILPTAASELSTPLVHHKAGRNTNTQSLHM